MKCVKVGKRMTPKAKPKLEKETQVDKKLNINRRSLLDNHTHDDRKDALLK